VPVATATARSRARKDLQHLGSPPMMPTASSAHSPPVLLLGALGEAMGRLDRKLRHRRRPLVSLVLFTVVAA
jgi:hypothetical protein